MSAPAAPEHEADGVTVGPAPPVRDVAGVPMGPTRLAGSTWGLAVGAVSIVAVHGSFVFAFFFLGSGAADWPPDGMGPPSSLRGLGTTGLLLLGLGLSAVAWRLSPAGARGGVRLACAGAALVAGAGAVLTGMDVAGQIPAAVDHAYPGIVALLHGVVAASFGAGAVMAVVLAVAGRLRREDAAVLAGWWLLTTVLWLATFPAVQIWSRIQ